MRPILPCLLMGLLAQPGIWAQEATAAVVKTTLSEFRRDYRSTDERVRLAAVDRLLPVVHKSIADELRSVAVKDRDLAPRLLAIKGLEKQDPKLAGRHLWSAFQAGPNYDNEKARRAIMESLLVVGHCPPFKELTRGADRGSKEELKAICALLRFHRDLESVEFLAERLDMPQPEDVDSPTNPPASYWQEKVEVWTHCIETIHLSLRHLTGRDFAESKEIRAWRKSGGKIVSIEEGNKALKGH